MILISNHPHSHVRRTMYFPLSTKYNIGKWGITTLECLRDQLGKIRARFVVCTHAFGSICWHVYEHARLHVFACIWMCARVCVCGVEMYAYVVVFVYLGNGHRGDHRLLVEF